MASLGSSTTHPHQCGSPRRPTIAARIEAIRREQPGRIVGPMLRVDPDTSISRRADMASRTFAHRRFNDVWAVRASWFARSTVGVELHALWRLVPLSSLAWVVPELSRVPRDRSSRSGRSEMSRCTSAAGDLCRCRLSRGQQADAARRCDARRLLSGHGSPVNRMLMSRKEPPTGSGSLCPEGTVGHHRLCRRSWFPGPSQLHVEQPVLIDQ